MTTYGNGDTIGYRYNRLGLVDQTVRTDGDNTRTFNWAYSSVGVLLSHTDSVNNRKYNYDYDSLGRLVRQEIRTSDNSSNIGFVEQGYDLRNNVNKLILSIGSTTVKQTYSYSAYSKNDADGNAIANSSASYAKDNLPTIYQISGTRYATYNYDSVNRLNKRTLSTVRPIYNNYVYWLSDRNTADTVDLYRTHQLLREIVDNTAYDYTYDVSGNITSISKAQRAETNTDAIGITGSAEYRSYAYDNLNQLIRENNASNNKTTTFSYDELGNITSKTEYAYTTGDLGTVNKTILYGYSNDGKQGWNNLLTSVDLNGDGIVTTNEQITYDEIGNPTSYLGNTLAWDGRQLTSYNNISYSYDADGIRASKTVGNTKTEYYYVGDVIHYQVSTNITTGEKVNELYFLYDSYGHLTAIRHATSEFTNYYYVTTNMQGDVLGIYTSGGDLITAYDYDAWGNCTATNYIAEHSLIGEINPIRYRGYYYDIDTGLYYLNSRYYDANIGRFLNADGYISTGQGVLGHNMFAYCGNNPVVRADDDGECWDYVFDIVFIIWSVADVCNNPSDWKNWLALGIDIVFAVVPFVPSGVGQVVKVGNKVDDVADIASAINKLDDVGKANKITIIGRDMGRVKGVGKLIGKSDELYKCWEGYNKLYPKSKFLAEAISASHDGLWLYGKLRTGYTVIDIGLSMEKTKRGLYYGLERAILGTWKNRNLWKMAINYYL